VKSIYWIQRKFFLNSQLFQFYREVRRSSVSTDVTGPQAQ